MRVSVRTSRVAPSAMAAFQEPSGSWVTRQRVKGVGFITNSTVPWESS